VSQTISVGYVLLPSSVKPESATTRVCLVVSESAWHLTTTTSRVEPRDLLKYSDFSSFKASYRQRPGRLCSLREVIESTRGQYSSYA
jgi:hypothetical protein